MGEEALFHFSSQYLSLFLTLSSTFLSFSLLSIPLSLSFSLYLCFLSLFLSLSISLSLQGTRSDTYSRLLCCRTQCLREGSWMAESRQPPLTGQTVILFNIVIYYLLLSTSCFSLVQYNFRLFIFQNWLYPYIFNFESSMFRHVTKNILLISFVLLYFFTSNFIFKCVFLTLSYSLLISLTFSYFLLLSLTFPHFLLLSLTFLFLG